MSDNVVDLHPGANPDAMLESSIGELDSALLVGFEKDGTLRMQMTSNIDAMQLNWIIDNLKSQLLMPEYVEVE